MLEYKVEVRAYYSKVSLNKNHIVESSQADSQTIIDQKASEGWSLVSTDATNFGAALYVYLYFARNKEA